MMKDEILEYRLILNRTDKPLAFGLTEEIGGKNYMVFYTGPDNLKKRYGDMALDLARNVITNETLTDESVVISIQIIPSK